MPIFYNRNSGYVRLNMLPNRERSPTLFSCVGVTIYFEGKKVSQLNKRECQHRTLRWRMAGSRKCSAENDGGLYVIAEGSISGSQRHGTIPAISIEVCL